MSEALVAQLICPSGAVRSETFERGIEVLERLDISHRCAPGALSREGYFAGSDEARGHRLLQALASDATALWMVRGGYGAIRTLHAIGEELAAHQPKPLWGFSDGTALLAAWDRMGWPAWHAPPLIQLPRLDAESLSRLDRAWHAGQVPGLTGLETLFPGTAHAPLAGGNLCVLASLVGTPYAARLKDRILLLEDIDEPAYRVNRLFTQLLYSGALDGVRGLVLGDFSGVDDSERAAIERFFAAVAQELRIPMARGCPSGHGTRNVPLPFGGGSGFSASLDASTPTATLTFHDV